MKEITSSLFLLIGLFAFSFPLSAQTTIMGTVTTLESKPVASVIVKLQMEGKFMGYATTDTKGQYQLTLQDSLPKACTLTFSHISYDTESEILLPQEGRVPSGRVDMILLPRSVALKEVMVKVRPVILKGDTLSYNLSSFLGKGDVTLEDGIKRLPGVSVSSGGGITYMGKPISEFQIEGLDLLGGNYSVATKNMKTEHVTQVEVMRGWNKHKVDKDEPSDNVAFNVKLAPKTKMKPIGNEEAGAGYMQDGYDKWLGKLGLTGMLFTKDFQTICSGQMGNYNDYAGGARDMYVNTAASSLLTDWGSGAGAPANYIFQRNASVSLNAIQRFDSIRTLRVNVDYSYHRQTYEAVTTSTYLGNDGTYLTIGEHASPYSSIHRVKLSATYDENVDNHYIYDCFELKGNFERNDGDMLYWANSTQSPIAQHRSLSSFEAYNRINYTLKQGKHRTDLYSSLSFKRTPSLRLNFSHDGVISSQTAQSTQFDMDNSISYRLNLGKGHRIDMPLNLGGSMEFVETQWLPQEILRGHNRLKGLQLLPGISPSYDWTSANKRLYLSGRLPLTWSVLKVDDFNDNSLRLSPGVTARYTFNANNKINFYSSYQQQTGDLAMMLWQMLTDTIQTSYRSYSAVTTGLIGRYKNWDSSLDWLYQQPLSFFTFHISLTHNRSWRNMLYSQSVNGIDLTNTSLAQNSRTRSTGITFSASKNIPSIFAKFTLNGHYSFGASQTAVNAKVIEPHTRNASCGTEISFTPISWLELKYDCSFGWNRTAYDEVKNEQISLDQDAQLHLFPISAVDISMRYNATRREVSDNQYKSLSLLGASAQWKVNPKMVLRLELNNLLNRRHYSYTLFDGVNVFTYDTYLCGRNAMFSVVLTL